MQYKIALNEHKIAKETNLQLQTKLFEYFRQKKSEGFCQNKINKNDNTEFIEVVDYEMRYNKYVFNINELNEQCKNLQSYYENEIQTLQRSSKIQKKLLKTAYDEHINYKYKIAKQFVQGNYGKNFNPKDITDLIELEIKKDNFIKELRLKNIELKHKLIKIEKKLKSKENLGDGLQLIDFEQLKIENQTYAEKLEERNEEINKLKTKISKTVQIVANVREKLQFTLSENAEYEELLQQKNHDLRSAKKELTKLKHIRDDFKNENVKLKRSCGLFGQKESLFNYEDCVQSVDKKTEELEQIKQKTLAYQEKTQKFKNLLSLDCKNN